MKWPTRLAGEDRKCLHPSGTQETSQVLPYRRNKTLNWASRMRVILEAPFCTHSKSWGPPQQTPVSFLWLDATLYARCLYLLYNHGKQMVTLRPLKLPMAFLAPLEENRNLSRQPEDPRKSSTCLSLPRYAIFCIIHTSLPPSPSDSSHCEPPQGLPRLLCYWLF